MKTTSKLIFIILPYLLFTSCSNSKLTESRNFLKEYAFCKCLQYAYKDTFFFKQDLSIGVYREIADYPPDVYDNIDTLSKKAANEIKPSQIHDYDNKKAIFIDCFIFFRSRTLDSTVKAMDRKNFRSWEQ